MPHGFDAYRARWPSTPDFEMPLDVTARFASIFESAGSQRSRADVTVVLVRGYLGNTMRGNFVAARDALRAAGYRAVIARTRTSATIAENARALEVPDGELVFGGHSKGGLEVLTFLAARPDVAARTRAVLLAQTPRGGSPVLESLLLGWHRASLPLRRTVAEGLQRLGLRLLRARAGGLELTGPRLAEIVRPLDRRWPFPVWQTASWSSRPTVWLDSFHERLGEIRPGAAHDGQFYLEDLIWPGLPHVLLPHLDHAQPVMDGFGFDSGRYWRALVEMALRGAD